MVKCVNESIVLFSVFLLLLMIVPSAFASDAVDNQTVISSDEQIEISAVDDGGVIPVMVKILTFLQVLMIYISMHLLKVTGEEHNPVHTSTCSITD